MSWKFRTEGKGSGKREEREQRARHKGYRTVLQGDYHKEKRLSFQFSSVQLLSHADFLWPHGLQHARLPCLSPTPRAYSNSCPLSRGCHRTMSSSVVPFSFCLQSFPASGSFTVSHLFASVLEFASVLAKVLEFQLQHQSFQWNSGLISFRMDWLDLLAVQGTLKNLFQHHSSKASTLWCSAFFIVQLSQPYMTTGKTIALTRWTFVGKVISLLLNMLSRLVITFLPRS